ncbi:MAG: hypothetical protein APR54_11530 [Candidatus Cloacimonas sp. SDB]|nr:MAG: hypothetical protein APR54_11530 [Candidatus Cloacimonas sp. SDB]
MNTKDFLFEIGVEEIPAAYIGNAGEKLKSFFAENLVNLLLKFETIKLYTTPRRLAVKITNLQIKQEDQLIEKTGPAVNMAYDEAGHLTRSAQGFLRNSGAAEKDIFTIKTAKGEKIAVKYTQQGSDTEELLKNLIPKALKIIPFPKTMKWKNRDLAFARPIRWLLILWETKTIEMEYKNLKSGNYTYGNRFLSLENKIIIDQISDYENKLEAFCVIPDRIKRKAIIQDKIGKLINGEEFQVNFDNALLETVTDLVEYPEPVIAQFDPLYLSLPEKIITSTLSEHQKYFSISDLNGNITNKFLFVSNGDPQFTDLIKLGNEKVVKARLEDADFFYKEDIKIPFEKYVPKLQQVTFQEKLGSVLEKTERIVKNADFLCDSLKLPEFVKDKTLRTAYLCKADLVTLMLGEKEFTKLQGYIGWKYAEKSGEKQPVPQAIYEHYLPRWQNDRLPETMEGSITAIADKIDTVCGIIGIGMMPTGSKDPYALRRAANGIVQIIAEKKINISINELIHNACNILKSKLPQNYDCSPIIDFMKQRINWYLQEKNIEYDVIDSVMHVDHTYIPDLWSRARALQKLKKSSDFINLVTGFKRVSNIIENFQESFPFKKNMIQHNSEKDLYDKYLILQEQIGKFLDKKEYSTVLQLLIEYGTTIDKFFDDVLVNVEEDELRKNRYSLLLMIRNLFLKVADLSKIVFERNRV